ncbi:MAG: hypothetical protein KDC92_16650 [Bacteroidetes bacterium]|nr:hypothetical protein [Bacteroidota bacterium]
MAAKTDDELQSVINDKKTFVQEARQAAAWELERRGIGYEMSFEDELDPNSNKKIEQHESPFQFNKDRKFVTNDSDAPVLYTKRAITMFSVLFSTLFGSVLLMSNLKAIGNKNGRIWVLVFGIVYTVFIVVVANQFKTIMNLALLLNFGGAFILTEVFWNREIGREQKHQSKKIWKPLIISVLISIPFILAIIYGE